MATTALGAPPPERIRVNGKYLIAILAALMIALVGIMPIATPAYAASYTLSFNGNGGSGVPSAVTSDENSSVTIPSTAPTRSRYEFKGWQIGDDAANLKQPGDTVTLSANTTATAQWKLTGGTISVVTKYANPDSMRNEYLAPNGMAFGTSNSTTVGYAVGNTGELQDAAGNSLGSYDRQGNYTFNNLEAGTYTLKLGGTEKDYLRFVPDSSINNGSWQVAEDWDVSVTLDDTNTSVTVFVLFYYKAYDFLLTTDIGTWAVKEIYKEDGSYYSHTVNKQQKDYFWVFDTYEYDTGYKNNGEFAYNKPPYTTGTYHSGVLYGDHAGQYSVFGQGLEVPTLSDEEKAQGWEFKGWQLVGDTSGKIYTEEQVLQYKVTDHTTFKAVFERPQYAVTFATNTDLGKINGGASVSANAAHNDEINTVFDPVPTPTPTDGYYFECWYTDPGTTNCVDTDAIPTTKVTAPITYYAKYKPGGTVNIRYEDTDGKPIQSEAAINGKIGTDYNTSSQKKTIKGYTYKELKTGSDPETGKYAATPKTVTYVYKQDILGVVNVNWVDTAGKPLQISETLSGKPGTDYTAEQKTIEGYTFKEMKTGSAAATGKFEESVKTVTFVYAADVYGELDVYHVDTDGKPLRPTVHQSGKKDTEYNAGGWKTIEGYTKKALKDGSAAESGKYTDGKLAVTYVYTKDPTPTTGMVQVNYVNESNKVITPSVLLSGATGNNYTTEQKDLSDAGYTYKGMLTGSAAASGKFTDGILTVTYVYTAPEAPEDPEPSCCGLVVTNFVDEQGQPIATSENTSGKAGEAYETAMKDLKGRGYEFKEIAAGSDPEKGEYEGVKTVTYVYRLASGVRVQYVNEDGAQVAPPASMSGAIGENYATVQKDLSSDGYTFKQMAAASAPREGKFIDGIQVVTYVYTNQPGEPDNPQDPVNPEDIEDPTPSNPEDPEPDPKSESTPTPGKLPDSGSEGLLGLGLSALLLVTAGGALTLKRRRELA